jgi:hypothetical protein
MLELYDAMKAGLVTPEKTPYQTMTTLRRFARTRMRKPAAAQT